MRKDWQKSKVAQQLGQILPTVLFNEEATYSVSQGSFCHSVYECNAYALTLLIHEFNLTTHGYVPDFYLEVNTIECDLFSIQTDLYPKSSSRMPNLGSSRDTKPNPHKIINPSIPYMYPFSLCFSFVKTQLLSLGLH